jgi:integrase
MDLREVPNHKWDRTITPKTVRKYLNHLGLAFKLAVSEGYLEKNPRDGLIIADATETSVETERLDFRASHLRKIFGAPLFNTCHNDKAVWKPGGVKVRDHRYWIPILGLFTGARLSEITQLTAENVRQDHGIWYLEITNNDENGKKKVKTKQSKREVPLHQTIIDLGFIDFVKKRKKGLLFDHYGDAKRMSHEFSKWFGRFMDKLGLTDPGLTFHSYRHTWKTAARFANIPDGAADAMTGHAAQNVGDTYGRNKRRIEYLKEQVDRIHFAGLSLEG